MFIIINKFLFNVQKLWPTKINIKIPQKAEVFVPKVVGTCILGDGCVAKQMVFNQIDVEGLISLLNNGSTLDEVF